MSALTFSLHASFGVVRVHMLFQPFTEPISGVSFTPTMVLKGKCCLELSAMLVAATAYQSSSRQLQSRLYPRWTKIATAGKLPQGRAQTERGVTHRVCRYDTQGAATHLL